MVIWVGPRLLAQKRDGCHELRRNPAAPRLYPANRAGVGTLPAYVSLHPTWQATQAPPDWNRGWHVHAGGAQGSNVGGHSAPFFVCDLALACRRGTGTSTGSPPRGPGSPRAAGGLGEGRRRPAGCGTGGIRLTPTGADIETCRGVRRNATHPVTRA